MTPEVGEETIQAVLHGDTQAFRSILQTYGPQMERLVRGHVLPHEIPEVVQETFIRAYNSLRSYQGRSFERWLATIALRCCYERLRERYRPEKTFSALAGAEEDDPSQRLTEHVSLQRYTEETEQQALREELDAALQQLEPQDRMLLTLTFLEGYSVAETAAMMNMSTINVRVRVHRSKARLRKMLNPVSTHKIERRGT